MRQGETNSIRASGGTLTRQFLPASRSSWVPYSKCPLLFHFCAHRLLYCTENPLGNLTVIIAPPPLKICDPMGGALPPACDTGRHKLCDFRFWQPEQVRTHHTNSNRNSLHGGTYCFLCYGGCAVFDILKMALDRKS